MKLELNSKLPKINILKNRRKFKCNIIINCSKGNTFYIDALEKKDVYKYKRKVEKEALKEAEIKIKNKKSKKSKILSWIFLLINLTVITIILLVQAKDGEVASAGELHVNGWYLLCVFGLFAILMLCDQFSFATLIHKSTKVYRPNLSYKVSAIGRYYDVITPFATGGQPFQIYYLSKYGIKPSEAVSITLGKYIFRQIASIVFFGVALFVNLYITTSASNAGQVTIGVASWAGFIINFILLAIIILICTNKKIGGGLVIGFIKLGYKLKIVKDYKATFRKVMLGVRNWQSTIKSYNKSYFIVPANTLLSILYMISMYSIPYFIFCAFEGWQPAMWSHILTLAVMVDLAACFMPLPGGTGVAELSFVALFSSLFSTGNVFWALIIWRVASYYIYIIQGLLLLLYDAIIGNKRLSKNKEKWSKPKVKIEFTL